MTRQILALVTVSCSIATVAAAQSAHNPAGTVAVPGATSAATQLGGPSAGANLVLNGDFESYSGGACDPDLSNAEFTALMANATAFGSAEEIDVCRGTISGVRRLRVRCQSDGDSDTLSLDLSSPLVAGSAYTVTFLATADNAVPFGLIQVGISASATDFGTPVHTGAIPIKIGWVLFAATFVAPVGARFLTINEGQLDAWSGIDAFTLTQPVLGGKYCLATANSTGVPADISASGSASVAAGNLTLTAAPVSNQWGMFFHGANQAQIPYGSSFFCATGNIARGAFITASNYVATYTYDNSDAEHSLSAFIGSIRNFQYWFREINHHPIPARTSIAIAITIEP